MRQRPPSAARADRHPTVLVAHPSADLYGSDRMTLESVDGLRERGWRVVVTVPATGPLTDELAARGVEVVACPVPVLRRSAMTAAGSARLLRSTLGAVLPASRLLRGLRPDAVYVSTVTVPLWLLLSRALGVPSVCHVHEAEAAAPSPVRRLLALPLLLADRVVANSRCTRDVATGAVPALASRTSVVLNGVAGPAANTPPSPVLDAPVELVCVGRLSARKGVDVAVDALVELRSRGADARLTLVGDAVAGSEDFERDLHRAAARGGVGDRVAFAGYQSDPWPFLRAADVALVPSRGDESFGNTAVEAVLAGRPSVVSDIDGLREACGGLVSPLLVPAGDAVAVADAVQRLVDDWPARRAAAQRDATLVRERHAPSRYRAAVHEQLASLVAPDPRLHPVGVGGG